MEDVTQMLLDTQSVHRNIRNRAVIASIEHPHKQWPQLISALVSGIRQLSPHVKQATLKGLGHFGEGASPDVVDKEDLNRILTAVVQGMSGPEVRLDAMEALHNEDLDHDEGARNIATVGRKCLSLVARTAGDDVVPLVMPFIEQNIAHKDWRQRVAATYAFGTILEGPSVEKLTPLVNNAWNFLLTALVTDLINHVKDITCWTISRILECLHGSATDGSRINQGICQHIVFTMLHSLKDTPSIANTAYRALYFLAQGYEDVIPSPLTPYFRMIAESLVIKKELMNSLEGQQRGQLQGLLCGCLQVIIQKLGAREETKEALTHHADDMMGLFLRILGCGSTFASEAAMVAIGALAYAAGPDFEKYMPVLFRYLEMRLQNFEDYNVYHATVYVISVICRALEEKVKPYCDAIMTQLLTALVSNQLHRSLWPVIFSCFGNIAIDNMENVTQMLLDTQSVHRNIRNRAVIASIEHPHKQWPQLISALVSGIRQLPPHVKQATLKGLGHFGEGASPDVVDKEDLNRIFTAVVQGMSGPEVRLDAMEALHNEDLDHDEGARNIATVGRKCLSLVARTAGDDVVPLVMPFIEQNIAHKDWRQRVAATYAFGTILEGPSVEKLTPLVNNAWNFLLIALVTDPINHVKDTTCWTISRILECLHGSATDGSRINQGICQHIVFTMLHSLKDTPSIANTAYRALYFLAQGYEDVIPSPLTPYFRMIAESLVIASHREDAGGRLSINAYSAMTEFIRCSTQETASSVVQVLQVIKKELMNSLEGQQRGQLQGLLCGCLQVIIQKLGAREETKEALMHHADDMMGLFLRILGCGSTFASEAAMVAIGALAYAAGPDFEKYMPVLFRYLEMRLQNFGDYNVYHATVYVISVICRALEEKVKPYCDAIMTQLLTALVSNQLHRSLWPVIFSCFGNIAMSVGSYFDKYLMHVVPILESASA
ncbi:Importin subunit beta-1 [Linum perenne]